MTRSNETTGNDHGTSRELLDILPNTVARSGTLAWSRREYVMAGVGAGLIAPTIGTAPMRVDASSTAGAVHIEGWHSPVTYELTVTGTLLDDSATPFDASENISGRNAEGTAGDLPHGYRYKGTLSDLQVGGAGCVFLHGDHDGLPQFGPPDSLRIVGTNHPINYEITVSGSLHGGVDDEYPESAHISGGNAEGTLREDVHSYRFTGDVTDIRLDGPAMVFVAIA